MPTKEEIFDVVQELKLVGCDDYYDYNIPESTLISISEKVLEVINDELDLLKVLKQNGFNLTRVENDRVVITKDNKEINQLLWDSGDRLSWRLRAALESTKPSEEGTAELRKEILEIVTKHNFPDN